MKTNKPKARSPRVDLNDKSGGGLRSSGASNNASFLSKSDINLLNINGAVGIGGGASVGGNSGSAGNISSSGGGGGGGGAASGGPSGATAAAIRKRRSSINVYDQPSSLNSRLRQLETDMLRLDEDRTKLYDDTHSALASFELRVSEIHSILKSRQDNAEKSVEDMKLLLAAKDELERQANLVNEKHERLLDKFMHRETIVARELKLLKNKFELLEKSRQFRAILQKSNAISSDSNANGLAFLDAATASTVDAISGGASANGSRRNSQVSLLDISATNANAASLATGGGGNASSAMKADNGKRVMFGCFSPLNRVASLIGTLTKACGRYLTFPASKQRLRQRQSRRQRQRSSRIAVQQATASAASAITEATTEGAAAAASAPTTITLAATASACDALSRRTSKVTPAAA